MPDHVRTQIRDAVAARLSGLATSGNRVFPSRIYPLGDASLPCLLVYLDEETISELSIGAPILDRFADLQIRACAKANAGLDSLLDTMLAEVETAMASAVPVDFGLLKSQPVPIRIDMQLDDSLEKPVGFSTITYRINYCTAASSPTTAI